MKTDRAIERFLEAAGISAGTRRGYATDLREFALWFGASRPLDEVDVRVLTDWLTELGRARPGGKLAPATIGRKLVARLHPNSAFRRVPMAVSRSASFKAGADSAAARADLAVLQGAGRRIGS